MLLRPPYAIGSERAFHLGRFELLALAGVVARLARDADRAGVAVEAQLGLVDDADRDRRGDLVFGIFDVAQVLSLIHI